MKKYEYVTLDVDQQRGMTEDQILETLGKTGWELTQVFSEPQDGLESYKIKHYYRRELIHQYQF
tara:strand:+ start:221 stop:412 length:192 start_codon:yes stop_codon:yes gene_type:complete